MTHRDYAAGFDTEPYRIKVYPTAVGVIAYIVTQGAVGNFAAANIAAYVTFKADGNIEYHNGVAWVDTGADYTANACNALRIVHNCAANTFDMWLGAVQIVNGGGFYNNQASIKNLQIGVSGVGDPDECWFDDIQVGEWTGKVSGVTNPAKVNGVSVVDIAKVMGVS